MHDLYREMLGCTKPESVIQWITNRTMEVSYGIPLKENLSNYILADNPTRKYLACRLSAMLHEFEYGPPDKNQLPKKLFESSVDIEHVQPIHDKDGNKRENVWKDWGNQLHNFGNLIILERAINRSISNEDYSATKRERYKKSEFTIVRAFAEEHEQWDLDVCKKREEKWIDPIVTYLMGLSAVGSEINKSTP